MDKMLFRTKHTALYFSTLTIGVGVTVVPENKSFHLHLLLLELEISLLEDWHNGDWTD